MIKEKSYLHAIIARLFIFIFALHVPDSGKLVELIEIPAASFAFCTFVRRNINDSNVHKDNYGVHVMGTPFGFAWMKGSYGRTVIATSPTRASKFDKF